MVMNRRFLMILAALCVVFACSKDDITGSSYNTGADDSAGSTIDTDASDDYVANTTFAGTVTVTYSSSSATVSIGSGLTASEFSQSVSGAGVTITYSGTDNVIYKLTGTTSDGYFKLYSSKKQEILLDGVSITNSNGAAINNQSKKRTFVVLSGTNKLADGGSYSNTPSTEDEKAAFFSEGQLIFSGSGSLSVTASGKAGITSDDYVRFLGGTIDVTTSSGHGVRGKDAIIVTDGTIDVNVTSAATGKKGFSSDTLVYFAGGTTTITNAASAGTVDGELTGCAGIKADLRFEIVGGTLNITSTGTGSKGINCDNVGYFTGGTVNITVTGSNYGNSSNQGGGPGNGWGGGGSRPRSVDDGTKSSDTSISSKGLKFDGNIYFNGADVTVKCSNHEGIESKATITVNGGSVYSYASDDSINAASTFTVNSGYVFGQSTGNDGMDANGNFYIKGGVVYAVGTGSPEVGLDANTEGGYKLYIQGGTVIAVGGLEGGSSLSQGYVSASVSSNTSYAVESGSTVLAAFKTPSSLGVSNVAVSCPSMKNGSSYTFLSGATVSGGTSYFGGLYTEGATASGGSSSSLTATTTSSGGMGGGGFR